MTTEPIRTFDQAMLFAWQAELKATRNPSIKQQCLQRECELLPCFAEHYQQLKSLRRRVRRSLQRQWKCSLTGLALLIALGQAPALAATINVRGTCSLAKAITAANNDTTVSGNCRKGSGADTIVLPRNSTQTLTTVNNAFVPPGTSFAFPTGLPVIRSVVTISGNGSTIRRAKSAPRFGIFSVAQRGKLTLQQATVSGGTDGLFNNGGLLNVVNSTISGNTGCGIRDSYFNDRYRSGQNTINKGTISGNTGCGISTTYTERLVVSNSTISNNGGGAVYADYSSARIVNSTISGNGGSGVVLYPSAYTAIISSTITGNAGSKGCCGRPAKLGGGVYVALFSSASIVNSTISGNSADVGAGVYVSADSGSGAELTNSTITGNTANSQGGGKGDRKKRNRHNGAQQYRHLNQLHTRGKPMNAAVEDIDGAVKAACQSFETRRWTGMMPERPMEELHRLVWRLSCACP
jgi:hypothetical protein